MLAESNKKAILERAIMIEWSNKLARIPSKAYGFSFCLIDSSITLVCSDEKEGSRAFILPEINSGAMPRMYASDEAIINGPPKMVYEAILNEYGGVTHWWTFIQESILSGNTPVDQEGATIDILIHSERAKGMPKFTYKLTRMVEPKSIDVEITGDIQGNGRWTFESIEQKTKAKFEWDVKPKRLLYVLLSPFVDMGKIHSDVMQKGFVALNNFLEQKSTAHD